MCAPLDDHSVFRIPAIFLTISRLATQDNQRQRENRQPVAYPARPARAEGRNELIMVM
jgi:hypothetical protein